MPWIYRPNHPNANENGMVDRSEAYDTGKSSAPYVISDNMDPLRHHATGKVISSKRAFSKETRAAGCVELGNEPIRPRAPVPLDKGARREAIRRTIYELRNGRS
jgi:hypothetical protein